MHLHEYQSKQLLADYGVATPAGRAARTVEEAERYTAEIGMNVTHSFYFELIAEMGTAGLIAVGGLVYYNWRDLGRVDRVGDVLSPESTPASCPETLTFFAHKVVGGG